ncbi:DNA-binding response OmpR family regulator [Sphingobium sp. OAS761]|uniref:winged helix-turn-helix domain-containing protein n=1 Tax=Sphingobium sp. OAS761 TaxID=2817901 RepID=UPI00209DF496|nr:response regulator transcription factor [Sphingobium sp. OAS761]MCP1468420.1 DNA-binding response OmpR family regulator [Sphingobium sp. OAS761]
MGSDFAPVARALSARGYDLAIERHGGRPHVRAGGATILWQHVDDPAERARALEGGAHDVVGPWMHEAETVARIVRLAQASGPRLCIGDLQIHLVDRSVTRGGRTVALLAREYALLLHLARHAGQVVSRTDLLRAVWRLDFDPGTNSVEVHMSRLRGKIDRGFARPMLRTVKRCGYMLDGAERHG